MSYYRADNLGIKFYFWLKKTLNRILPIKRTVRIEVENFFWSRGIDDLPFNRTPQWLPIGEHCSLNILRLCALAVQLASDVCCYNHAREIVNWSKLRPCGEYEQWEHASGGKFYEFFVTFALVIHPLTMKNRPCALIRSCALNRKNMVSLQLLRVCF